MRAVRPNSVMATTEVSFQRSPRPFSQGLEGAVEPAQKLREAAGGAALVGVRVPAVEGQRGDARPVVGGHQLGRALGHAAACRREEWRQAGHALARRHLVGLEALGQRRLQDRIALRVEIHHPRRQVVRGVGQDLRRPAEHRHGPAHDQRRRRPDGEAALDGDAVAPGHRADGPVEPARLREAGAGLAAFEDILAVEVRALAIGRGGGMDDGGAALLVKSREDRHRRVEGEEAVERDRRMLARERERERAVQARRSWDRRREPTAARPSSPPRRTITTRRGSRAPAARASLGR